MPLVHLTKHYLVLPELSLFNNCLEPQVYYKKQSHETQYSIAKLRAKDPFIRSTKSFGKQLLFSYLKDIMQLAAEHVFPLAFLSLRGGGE